MKTLGFLVLLSLPGLAGAQAPAPTKAATVAKVGASVVGKDNKDVGKIVSVTEQSVVIDTGTHQVPVPPASIGTNPKGYWIGMTKAELDAAYAQAAEQAKANFAAQLVPGASVNGTNGAVLGSIKAVDAQSVTITTAKGDAQLPIAGFAAGANNTIVVGLTAEQLDAAMTQGAAPATPQQ